MNAAEVFGGIAGSGGKPALAESEPGSILCSDCGGGKRSIHFGEMSCQVANAHGCRGVLIAGNCRDTYFPGR